MEEADEDSGFLDVAESDACSLMEVSCELSSDGLGFGVARFRLVEVKDRIGRYCRLRRVLEGKGLGSGSLKGIIIFARKALS